MPAAPSFGAEDRRRVHVALTLLMVLLGAVGGLQLASAILQRDLAAAAHGSLLWVGLFALAGTRVLVRRGPLDRAVLVGCLVLLALTVPTTAVQHAGPVVLGGPILVVCLALPYLRDRALMGLSVAAVAVGAVNVTVSEVSPGPAVAAGPIPVAAVHVLFAVLVTGAVVFLLYQFSTRMRQLRDQERASRTAAEDLGELVRTVVHGSPVAIAVFDLDGVVRLWNPACSELFGVPSAQAVGRGAAEVLAGDDRVGPLVERVRRGEHVRATEVDAGGVGGPRLSLEVSAAPLRQGDRVTGYVVLGTDVSTRKRLEADIQQAQKMESVGMLAGGIAHDFNNLLTIITAETSLLADDTLLSDEPVSRHDADSLEAIADAARRAAELCRQLLAFSQRQLVHPKPHDLGTLVSEVIPMLRRIVGGAVTLHFTPPAGSLVVKLDRTQFEQVALNLVVNARDAMPHGGDIYLSLAAAPRGAVLSVRDTGAGMADDVRDRVFEPFFTTKERGRGTGLGLATVADIVRRAGGSIEVATAPGRGSEFRVTWPIAHADHASPAATQPPAPSRLGQLKVLVVDDDPDVRQVVEKMLLAHPCVVLAADAASTALDLLDRHEDFDLMVTDVVMRGINGRVLAERAQELRPGLPVLFISGYSTDPELAARVEAGEVFFLAKPFTRKELEAAVERVLVAAGKPRAWAG